MQKLNNDKISIILVSDLNKNKWDDYLKSKPILHPLTINNFGKNICNKKNEIHKNMFGIRLFLIDNKNII